MSSDNLYDFVLTSWRTGVPQKTAIRRIQSMGYPYYTSEAFVNVWYKKFEEEFVND